METLKRIEALEAELKKLKDEVNNPIKVGDWIHRKGEYLVWNGGKKTYGFNIDGIFDINYHLSSLRDCNKADMIKVKNVMLDEAKKKYPIGTKIVGGFGGNGLDEEIVSSNQFAWTGKSLYCIGGSKDGYALDLFKDGEWATITKEDIIKIGKYEVKFEYIYQSIFANIGCKAFSKQEIIPIYDFMITFDLKKVAFDNVEVDINTIKKIIDKL